MYARPAVWIVALVFWSTGASAARKTPSDESVRSPVQVTATFYRWYITKYRSDHDPMLELRAESGDRLSTALLDELESQLVDVLPDQDYFLQADDSVRPCRSFDVRPQDAASETARIIVTLASRTSRPWQVRATLSKEGRSWRIRDVARDPRRPGPGAAARALGDC